MAYDTLVLFVTKRCNLHCPFCLWVSRDPDFFTGDEMNLDEVEKILRHFKSKGFKGAWILAEGEILVYPHFEEAVSLLKTVGFPKSPLITNGILIDEHLDFICKNFNSISVSVDGPDFEEYKKIRGSNKKTFERILNNTRALVERGKDVKINFVIQKNNMHNAQNMIKLCRQLGVGCLQFRNFHPVGTGSDLVPLYSDDPESKAFVADLKRSYGKLKVTPPVLHNKKIVSCRCDGMLGKTVIIGANGDFQPCCHIPSGPEWGNFWEDPEGYINAPQKKSLITDITVATCRAEVPESCIDCPRLITKTKK